MLNVNYNGDGCHATCGSICDACWAPSCMLYCHTALAYLCASCDATLCRSNPVMLWHGDASVCMLSPAAFTCNADAASLVTNWNPFVAARHEWVPMHPMSGFSDDASTTYPDAPMAPMSNIAHVVEKNEDETDSWLLLSSENNDEQSNDGILYDEVDGYLDLAEFDSCTENFQYHDQYNPQQSHSFQQENTGSDCVVPLPLQGASDQQQEQQQNFYLGMAHEMSKAGFIYNPSRSVAMPFIDVGVVPEATTSSISNSCSRLPEGMFGFNSNTELLIPPAFTSTNREEKVLRYREKRKGRKIEKKIRHASRKIHAETQPRVKGRFAKRAERDLN